MNNLADINNAIINISLLTVYKNFLCDDVCIKFVVFLEAIKENEEFAKVIAFFAKLIIIKVYQIRRCPPWHMLLTIPAFPAALALLAAP